MLADCQSFSEPGGSPTLRQTDEHDLKDWISSLSECPGRVDNRRQSITIISTLVPQLQSDLFAKGFVRGTGRGES